MEEEKEDIVGEVNSDSQKSVSTTNAYSMDFTDSNSDKNNSTGKETYVIELYDSEDSEIYSLRDKKSAIKLSQEINSKDVNVQCEIMPVNKHNLSNASSANIPSRSIVAQEIFTQTSKTIIELARAETTNREDLETQTSFISITENKTVQYTIEVKQPNRNVETKAAGSYILSKGLEDESSKFEVSDSETIKSDGDISNVSSDKIISIVDDESNEDVLMQRHDSVGSLSSSDSDIEDDSLMEPRTKGDSRASDNQSDISEIPKSLDNEIEELYLKISENIQSKMNYQNYEPIRPFNTLTPLTEESTVKHDSLMNITPDNKTIVSDNVTYVDTKELETDKSVLFTNNSGIKVKMLPNVSEDFKLPPIQNLSYPNSPQLNFLFSVSTPKRPNQLDNLRSVHDGTERPIDRWEMKSKELASGESALIKSKNEADANSDTVHLPPIHIDGYTVKSKINKTDGYVVKSSFCKTNTCLSNIININPTDTASDSISINERIKELKINSRSGKKPQSKFLMLSNSRSGSPSSNMSDDSKLLDTAERGCEALCAELLRRLKSTLWYEVVDILEEIPQVLNKFWGVISEQRIADLVRQINIHIESPRTQVARVACNSVAVILKNTNYTKKPDFFEAVSLLLNKTGSFSRPVRRAANVALDQIACSVDLSNVITALCIHGASHKSGAVRSAAARLLVVCMAVRGGGRARGVLRARPPSAAIARAHALRALSNLLDDKNTDARKYAERLYSMLSTHSSFEAFYLTDVNVEVATRQMKKYDKLLICAPTKNTR